MIQTTTFATCDAQHHYEQMWLAASTNATGQEGNKAYEAE
jgi:hypothetical protein